MLQIGDSNQITPISFVLAVQKELPLFATDEGEFGKFRIFNMSFPPLPPITEQLKMEVIDENPSIHVNHIHILGISTSGNVHVGSTCHIQSEARVKHFRHLLKV